VDGKCVQDLLPAVYAPGRVGAVLPPFGGDEVEDLERRLLVGEVAPVPDSAPEPGVEALDGVGNRYESGDAAFGPAAGFGWQYGATVRDRGVGGTSLGRPIYSLSCELALVLGRPCDLPGCAASANP
jgi:hypothetical protein